MPDIKTEISELGTALGALGLDVATALAAPPVEVLHVGDDTWARLREAHAPGEHADLFAAAWGNGRAFLTAANGLRGRIPIRIEWKGPSRPIGYESIPADLRIDHVYLVSCKHRSRILHNTSPANVFDRALAGRAPAGDWFLETAPDEYQHLYEVAVAALGLTDMPAQVTAAGSRGRELAAGFRRGTLPAEVATAYAALCATVSEESARRWCAAVPAKGREELLWRLIRLTTAPYFLLGASPNDAFRIQVLTPYDWRQRYRFDGLDVYAGPAAGQPMVRWAARVTDKGTGEGRDVEGIVEVRWSHGRLNGAPEAKVQLVTPHERVPGYEPLT